MSNQARTRFLLAVGVLIALCAVYGFTARRGDGVIRVLDGSRGDVTAIVSSVSGETVRLEKREGKWQWAGAAEFPLNTGFVDTMLDKLCPLEAARALSSEAAALEMYGLSDSDARITVETPAGSVSLVLGDRNSATGEYYLALEGTDGIIYTVSPTLFNVFSHTLYDMAITGSLDGVSLGNAVSVSIYGAEPFAIQKQSDGTWREAGGGLLCDESGVKGLIASFLGMRFTDMLAYRPDAAELAAYKIAPDSRRALLAYQPADGALAKYELCFGAGAVYVKEFEAVYRCDAGRDGVFSKTIVDYYDKAICPVFTGDVTRITVRDAERGEYAVTSDEPERLNRLLYQVYLMTGDECAPTDALANASEGLVVTLFLARGDPVTLRLDRLNEDFYIAVGRIGKAFLIRQDKIEQLLTLVR